MRVVDIDEEFAVDWLVRDLPSAALRGVARSAEADRIQRQAPVTASTLKARNGLVRYRRRLERATGELDAIVAVLELSGRAARPEWEQEARVYAEIGSACMDLAYHLEHRLLSAGEQAGRWAVRLVQTAHRLDAFLHPGAVALEVQNSYCTLFDTAVLDGRGRLQLVYD